MMAFDGRRRHRAQYLTAQKRTMLSRSIRASKQMKLRSRLRRKRRQTSPASEHKVEDDAAVFARTAAHDAPWLTRSRSIVERGRQPIAIGHRVDEPGPGANSPIVGMRKLEALLGFAD